MHCAVGARSGLRVSACATAELQLQLSKHPGGHWGEVQPPSMQTQCWYCLLTAVLPCQSNVVLEVLLLAGNDIGEDGARHLMTALAANNSLKFLGLSGSNLTGGWCCFCCVQNAHMYKVTLDCSITDTPIDLGTPSRVGWLSSRLVKRVLAEFVCAAAAVHDAAGSASDFNPASPDGSYTLDLSVAAERAVAVQLVELDRANATDLMKSITLDGKVRLMACR